MSPCVVEWHPTPGDSRAAPLHLKNTILLVPRVSLLCEVRTICFRLSFSSPNLATAFFCSTTFQLFPICFRFLKSILHPYESTGHMSAFSNFMLVFSNCSIFPDCFQFHCNFLGSSYYCLMYSDQLPVFGLMTSIYLKEFTFVIFVYYHRFVLWLVRFELPYPPASFTICSIFPVEICHRWLYHLHTANLKYIFHQQQRLISTIRLII